MANLKFEISKKAEERAEERFFGRMRRTQNDEQVRNERKSRSLVACAPRDDNTSAEEPARCRRYNGKDNCALARVAVPRKRRSRPATVLAGGLGFAADVGFEVGFVVR